MPDQPMPVPEQEPTPGGNPASVSQNVAPIAAAAQQAAQPKQGVQEAQMGKAPQAQKDDSSKKRMIFSVLGAAAGMPKVVQAINKQHDQNVQIRNQHVIDSVWQAHNNETQARNKVDQLKQAAQEIQEHMKRVQALPDDDPTKTGQMGYLAHNMQDVTKAIQEQAKTIQSSQQNIQAIMAEPKNRKIMEKAVGYDPKSAQQPERQQMIAAIQKSVPGTSPEEAQLSSQFPQGPSEAQPGLDPKVQEQVLKSATTQANIDSRVNQKPKETSDTRARADFDQYKQQHPDYKGSFEAWKTEQAAVGRTSQNRDDRYIAINQKQQLGESLSNDDKAYLGAYSTWVKKTKIDPGVARAAAFAANRYVPMIDPNDPNGENVVLLKAGDAARMGASSPQSIAFQTDKNVTRFMTAGQGGQNIANFNTAVQHLDLLKQAGDALQNGDVQLANKLGNKFATATGMPAPTNFDAVKMAVAGELSKTFKGAGATDSEISQINSTLNNAQSPQQINGAISYYSKLMNSKVEALHGQYQAGRQGGPAFKDEPKGPKVGVVENGYRFKGGDPSQQGNWVKVSK